MQGCRRACCCCFWLCAWGSAVGWKWPAMRGARCSAAPWFSARTTVSHPVRGLGEKGHWWCAFQVNFTVSVSLRVASLYILTIGITQSFVRSKGFHSFSCLLHTCKWLDIWMSCFSVSRPCEIFYQSSAGTKSYPGLRTVYPLSSKGHLFPSLCTQAAPCSNFCKCSHFSGGRGSCVGSILHRFDIILQYQPQGLTSGITSL